MGKYHHPSKTATPFREGFLKMRQIAMKKMKLIPPALILLCVGLFVGYQAWNRINADNKAPEVTIGTEILELSPALSTHGGPGCIVIQAICK